ncbi:MAG: DUF4339 domain-containing protein [Rhodopirellula sp.]|nr:DUF4339 domain-containing protein [Rhodopirellula sp.]
MTESSKHWYVEMSAGITLGPMPFEAIVDLAETSALMRNDRVRKESSKTWRPAHEVPGLFLPVATVDRVVSLSGFEVAETLVEARNQGPTTTEKPTACVDVTDGVVRLEGFEVLPGKAATTARTADDSELVLLSSTARRDTVAPSPKLKVVPVEKVKPRPSKKSGQRQASKRSRNREIPRDEIPELDVPPVIPLDEVRHSAPPPPSFEGSGTGSAAPGQRTIEVDSREVSSPPDLATLVNAGVEEEPPPSRSFSATVPPPIQKSIHPWRLSVDRSRAILVRGGFAGLALAVVSSLLWLLKPDVEAATYDQYAAIYQEYQRLADSTDAGSWSEFSTRARGELDETLPQLEAAAVPGERSKSLLLYAGRDLRSAMELTPGATNPHAARLASFFQQLNELHSASE